MRALSRIQRFNQRAQIAGVLRSWQQQYPGDKDGVAKKLAALNLKRCSPRTVEKIIGNKSWTCLFCSACTEYHDDGIVFDDGDRTILLCGECLTIASKLIEA